MKKWTEEEIKYLKNNYGKMSAKDLQLPGRTKVAMQNKAHKLNLTGYRQWSKKDVDYLMDSWGFISVVTMIGVQSVMLRARKEKRDHEI